MMDAPQTPGSSLYTGSTLSPHHSRQKPPKDTTIAQHNSWELHISIQIESYDFIL